MPHLCVLVDVGAPVIEIVVGVFQTHGAVGLAEALQQAHKGAPHTACGAQPVLLRDAIRFRLRIFRACVNKKK